MSQITEAEASREIYRVHLPGAENDLYSLLELRELALRKVIQPGTLISREGQSFQAPASSIPTVFSTREDYASADKRSTRLGEWGSIRLRSTGSEPLSNILHMLTGANRYLPPNRYFPHEWIDEAEASREIYRVHLPGADHDLYSAFELRQMALTKVISPTTPISIEGENIRVPASSIHTVYSTMSASAAFGCGCLSIAPFVGTLGFLGAIGSLSFLTELSFASVAQILIVIGILVPAWLLWFYQLVSRTAVDRQGRPLR